jgi:hypothetical protein
MHGTKSVALNGFADSKPTVEKILAIAWDIMIKYATPEETILLAKKPAVTKPHEPLDSESESSDSELPSNPSTSTINSDTTHKTIV